MTTQSAFPYQDASQSIADRLDDLLPRMTLDEKIAQLGSVWVFELFEKQQFSEQVAANKLKHGIGQITRIGGASNVSPLESAELANRIQAFLKHNTRLGIPAMVHEECCSGYMANGATLFPQAIGIASTWNPELITAMGDVIRLQMRSVGGHQALAPVLDVTRDPRWGRLEETFGEDPYLVATLGCAYIRGIQGQDISEGVVATGKHFVGYGMSEGGKNWAPVFIPERELREVFALPFEAAIRQAGLMSIMNAYHEMDGIPCGGSKALLVDMLRGQFGFEGIVVSDYFTIDMLASYHHVVPDKAAAAGLALEVGIDVELPSTNCYGEPLREALLAGKIDMQLVDAALARVLELKFRLGLFENPFVETGGVLEVFETAEQQNLAHRLAQESIVLLKNEGRLLPLSKSLQSIAVIGPNAHSVRNLMGDYAYPAHIETLLHNQALNTFGSPIPEGIQEVESPVMMDTVLEAIRQKVSPQTTVKYALGCNILEGSAEQLEEAIAIAQEAEVVILVVGDKAGLTPDCTSGESRDRAELGLPGVQETLVQAIAATGTPIVLVMVNGRPVTLSGIIEQIPAIVEAWLPGEKGANAIADVLFGDYNPGGKLAITFPRAVGQIPVFYNHKPSGGRSHWNEHYIDMSAKPQFPFGFGLSYTTFAFSNFQMDSRTRLPGDQVEISIDVTNTGDRLGDEVVQLYVRYSGTSVTRPVKELKGFKRITLRPAESKKVTFSLSVNQLAFYDKSMALVIEPAKVEVMIGSSSEDIHARGHFEIGGQRTEIGSNKTYFSSVKVD
jgi:beta-glucosidase